MTSIEIENKLKRVCEPDFKEKYVRFGINAKNALGVRHPQIKNLAKEIGTDHSLAIILSDHPMHEVRLLSPLIADSTLLTENEADHWVSTFYSWDLVDNACSLFAGTPFAFDKALEWCKSNEEFVRRSGLVTLVAITVHDKKAEDDHIRSFLEIAERYAFDDRNFVKKAVNWLIRQVGKRNLHLNQQAIEVAERLSYLPLKSAQWIAKDALRELKSDAVKERLLKKVKK